MLYNMKLQFYDYISIILINNVVQLQLQLLNFHILISNVVQLQLQYYDYISIILISNVVQLQLHY